MIHNTQILLEWEEILSFKYPDETPENITTISKWALIYTHIKLSELDSWDIDLTDKYIEYMHYYFSLKDTHDLLYYSNKSLESLIPKSELEKILKQYTILVDWKEYK